MSDEGMWPGFDSLEESAWYDGTKDRRDGTTYRGQSWENSPYWSNYQNGLEGRDI